MALEELTTTVSKLTFNFFGSESEKKVRGLTGLLALPLPICPSTGREAGWGSKVAPFSALLRASFFYEYY